jgi:hypothetical protein
MTEKEVQLLGFQKENTIGDDQDDSYYYVLDVVDGLSFITQSNDDVKNNEWHVEIFNTDPYIRFHKFEEVQGLINKLTKAIVKK